MTQPYDTYRDATPSFPAIVFTGSNSSDVTAFIQGVGAQSATFSQDTTTGAWTLTTGGVSQPVNAGDAIVATVDPQTLRWISRQWCADPTKSPLAVVPGPQFAVAFTPYIIALPPPLPATP